MPLTSNLSIFKAVNLLTKQSNKPSKTENHGI